MACTAEQSNGKIFISNNKSSSFQSIVICSLSFSTILVAFGFGPAVVLTSNEIAGVSGERIIHVDLNKGQILHEIDGLAWKVKDGYIG